MLILNMKLVCPILIYRELGCSDIQNVEHAKTSLAVSHWHSFHAPADLIIRPKQFQHIIVPGLKYSSPNVSIILPAETNEFIHLTVT